MGENCYTGNILKTLRKRVWQGCVAEGFLSLMLGITVKPTRILSAVCFYWHIRNGVRTYAFSRKSLLLDYRNIMLVRSWQNLRVARLRRIFTCRYRVVFVFFGVSDLSVCTAAWVGLKCIGGCFVGYYVRNIHASAICRFVAGCCNRAAAHCCQVLLGNVIFDSK